MGLWILAVSLCCIYTGVCVCVVLNIMYGYRADAMLVNVSMCRSCVCRVVVRV
jgi:hypothetical protein